MQPIDNNENDSSDEENGAFYSSPSDSEDDGDLSFESDDEGNLVRTKADTDDEEEDDELGNDDSESEDDDSDADAKSQQSDNDSSTSSEDEGESSMTPTTVKPQALTALQNELNGNGTTKKEALQADDEYKDDTSDEEDIRNTVGNIPMHWYDEYKHIGYDWDAKKIVKPARRDQLDDFLKKMEDPNFWRTVKDMQTGQDIILSEADIALIKRINSQAIPDANFEEYTPWIDWFTSEVEQMPITNVPDHKRSFLPSRSEKKTVSRLVNAIKMGWLKTKNDRQQKKKKGPQFYMLWDTDTDKEKMRRIHDHVSAPKRDLPGHAESYNPPPEYLFDEKELKEWHKFKDEPHRRKLHFVPQRYNSLREVPAYSRYVRERFLRCLDLYLCPRAKRMKLTIDAEYLIPKLPSPKDLQPFPTVESMVYTGHADMIRTISVEPNGEYLVSGSDDQTVKSKYK